jgi:hypothetical protein
MKRTQLFVVSVLALGLQGIAQATPFPADADASYNMPAADSYAERSTRLDATWGVSERQVAFPADAEASHNLVARDSHAERQARSGGSGMSARAAQLPFHVAAVAIDD